MTHEQYEVGFRKKAGKSGFSEDEIVKCLTYATILLTNKVPVIYNTSNLSNFVGYSKSYLKRAVLFTNYFYRTFKIRKRNGKLREISEPLPSLKEIQSWILKNILESIPVSKFAKAYVPKRTLLENVKFHRNKSKVVTLDIVNFFPSIGRETIEKIYLDLGYSSNVSNLLSKLCCCNEILPQGAPTSPYLSNIVLHNFDEIVASYCVERGIRYTRYADDLAFSGDFNEKELIVFVDKELVKCGFILNSDKIEVMYPNDRQIVTGIVVNKVVQIPKIDRDIIRQEVYYIKKFGLVSHSSHVGNKRGNYLRHLLGRVNFAAFINPKDVEMQSYKSFLMDLLQAEDGYEQKKI